MSKDEAPLFVATYQHSGAGICVQHGAWLGPLYCPRCEQADNECFRRYVLSKQYYIDVCRDRLERMRGDLSACFPAESHAPSSGLKVG